jgi:hypothetical protein
MDGAGKEACKVKNSRKTTFYARQTTKAARTADIIVSSPICSPRRGVEIASVTKVWWSSTCTTREISPIADPTKLQFIGKGMEAGAPTCKALNRAIHSPYAVSIRAVDARIVATITEL